MLKDYGWNVYWSNCLQEFGDKTFKAGRVIVEHKHIYRIMTEEGELLAEVSGKYRFNSKGYEDFPAVGDWVAVSTRPAEGKATIHGILKRRSCFSRKVAGRMIEEQVVAANFDYVFIVSSLNKELNLRRIERYLTLAWESGATPVLILTKADLSLNPEAQSLRLQSVAMGVKVHIISNMDGRGFDDLKDYCSIGKTIVLMGSSGVGKSSLVNRLMGEALLEIQEIGQDDKGRHTTTFRQLIKLKAGGMVIDTPGMRELQLWEGEEGLSETFADIEALSEKCRFKDCSHNNEPGCGVMAALETGTLSPERYQSYLKLQKEIKYQEKKQDRIALYRRKKEVIGSGKGYKR